jgi:choline-sulfatase
MSVSDLKNPNIVFFVTDQQRYPQHWGDWAEKNLHNLQRLRRHGLTFRNAFTAACECSPSRASMITSTYPQQNGVQVTFTTALSPSDVNMAAVFKSAGYPVTWKGKWHLSHPLSGNPLDWSEADIAYVADTYDIQNWNPPDAGTTLSAGSTQGAGAGTNDHRFIHGPQPKAIPAQSVCEFIRSHDPSSGSFCLVVSLVNPHDIFVYPGQFSSSGYDLASFQNLDIHLPHNQPDDLSTKPGVQKAFQTNYGTLDLSSTDQLNYVRLYAYLHTLSDKLFNAVMDELQRKGLIENTIIFRYADHGEMGLSHNLQEKMYTAYEEAMHIPLVISNPVLFPNAVETDALASSIDLVPTVAEIIGSTNLSTLKGSSLVRVMNDPQSHVHESVVYTYDDCFNLPAALSGHIRCLRKHRWKYAVYYSDAVAGGQFEYELYDLDSDRGEMTNLAYGTVSAETQRIWNDLHTHLTERLTKLGPLPTGNFTWPVDPAGSNVWTPVTTASGPLCS